MEFIIISYAYNTSLHNTDKWKLHNYIYIQNNCSFLKPVFGHILTLKVKITVVKLIHFYCIFYMSGMTSSSILLELAWNISPTVIGLYRNICWDLLPSKQQ